jgi:hypothetical protein
MKKLLIIILLSILPVTAADSLRAARDNDEIGIDYLRYYAPLTIDNLITALTMLRIQSPETVLAQAYLETGGFTSRLCKEYNNLFGMKYPLLRRSKALYPSEYNFSVFDNWFDCVEDYGYWQAYYAARGYSLEDYHAFLTAVGYAEDVNYINKLNLIKTKL